ncbi:hypothetical protein Sango_2286600 [Sesamum angolense]|uniref:Reverse transcriptase domain-containing protein n=1 Tax=Sesamum angolense TaxID=2727404 RepID=A0AAE2BL80_9LAMI|nr:hypothetical protein Sango_2286600 [Sesamum angolense]
MKKQLGVPPTWYELKDFADCCLALGLHDAETTECYYTWAKETDLALQNAQTHLESNRGDAIIWDSLGDLRKKAVFLTEVERHSYYQKAKIHFLKQGDRNTMVYHDVKRNMAKNSILVVTKSDGTIITSAPDIAQEFIGFYTSLLVTQAEVKLAVFQISDNKVPGPDGYTSCFFKKTWKIIGDLICRAVTDFFRSGWMLRQLNHIIIVLVPKFIHSHSVADYRPISCCNAGERRAVTPAEVKLAVFQISNNKAAEPDGYTSCFFKKAWNIMGDLICSDAEWLPTWIFLGMKGLRQGDPMSSALFLLCMEFFSRLIKRNTSNSDFNFHLKCEKLKITYFLFADDLMLFSRGDLPSIYILMECLQKFRDVSGLTVNISKSSIFTADIQNDVLDEIIARMEFARGDMPVRYLGIPLAAKRLLAGWNLYVPLFRVWSVFGYKFSYSQRQLLRRFTDCAGPSSGILREHRWPGRKFAIRKEECGLDTLLVKWVNEVYLQGASLWDWQAKKGDSPLLRRLADI